MFKLPLALSIFAGLVAADYTTSLFLFNAGYDSMLGRIIASDATATTYSLDCPPSDNSVECGIPTSFHFTQGPSTVHYQVPAYDEENETIDFQCKVTSDGGQCTISYTIPGQSASLEQTTTSIENFSLDVSIQKVVITSNAIPGATGTTSPVSSTTAAATSSATTSAAPGSSKVSSAATTSPSATGSSTKVSTGGLPVITGPPCWLVGGIAAVAAVIAPL